MNSNAEVAKNINQQKEVEQNKTISRAREQKSDAIAWEMVEW